jgi:hypothetical protein
MYRKTTVLKVPQMASCPSDVNKKVMLTMCFSCFYVPIFKKRHKKRVNSDCASLY